MEEKDYKKLYEDVVALAKDGLKDGLYLSQSAKAVTEYLFPQLKETEDEKVKRELNRFLINFNNGCYSRPSEDKIDSWIKWVDKKCEQKPTDKVEPKFKVGDWVKSISSGNIFKILSFNDGLYRVLCYDGVEANYPIEVEKDLAHWTIQDAKDGDALYFSDETIVIFKDLYNATTFHSYCHIEYGLFVVKDDMPDWWEGKGFQPATKEQRDFLFQKMKENGYEWDAEKKELNKIEQESTLSEEEGQKCSEDTCKKSDDIATEEKDMTEYKHGYKNGFECGKQLVLKYPESFDLCRKTLIAWSEEDEKMWSQVINEIEAIKSNSSTIFEKNIAQDKIDWLKSIKDRVQPQPTPEWSEYDKIQLSEAIQMIEANGTWIRSEDAVKKVSNWLKSLKDKAQPQPTSEWSKEDEKMLNDILICGEHHCYLDAGNIAWLKSLKNRVRPNQEWSEEDEKKLNDTIFFLNEFKEVYHDDAQNCIKWVKSFKPQQNQYDKGYNDGYSAAKYNQWKPTDKQMEDFRMLLDYNIGVFDYVKFMSADSLYEDLKKNLID